MNKVAQMLAELPSIPYPSRPNRHNLAKWVREATAAGYPLCATCSNPISRANWVNSIEFCPRHMEEAK